MFRAHRKKHVDTGVFIIILWSCFSSCQSRNTIVLAKLVSFFFTHQTAAVVFCKGGLYCSQDTGMGLWYEMIVFLPIDLLGHFWLSEAWIERRKIAFSSSVWCLGCRLMPPWSGFVQLAVLSHSKLCYPA